MSWNAKFRALAAKVAPLTAGWATFGRSEISTATLPTGDSVLRLTYFTADKGGLTTGARMFSGGTAAGATPTLLRVGLYAVDGLGAGTLVAATASDLTLLTAANTEYSKAWAAPYSLVKGQRYAIGLLVVTAAAAPTMLGTAAPTALAADYARAPRLTGSLAAQADLPASFTDAGLATSLAPMYLVAT